MTILTGLHVDVEAAVIERLKTLLPTWKGKSIRYTTIMPRTQTAPIVIVRADGGIEEARWRTTSVALRVVLNTGSWGDALELGNQLAAVVPHMRSVASTDNRIVRATVTVTPYTYETSDETFQATLSADITTRALASA